MQTIRSKNQSVFVYLGASLGSLFGLMGIFSSVMASVEDFYEKYERKKKNRFSSKEIKSKTKVLKSVLGIWSKSNKSNKIIPIHSFKASMITITTN